jgi:hypothetical protein
MIPTWAIVLDYILGTIMWTLIGRAFMNIFQIEWFFYLFRFYAMPYILGYDVWGMLAFPLESDFSRQLYRLFN